MTDTGAALLDSGAIKNWIDRLYSTLDGSLIAPGKEFVLWDRTADGKTHIEWLDAEKAAATRSFTFAGGAADGGEHNAYYHVCLHSWDEVEYHAHSLGKKASHQHNRGCRESATVFPAAWVEVDFVSDGHKSTNLPPDRAAALQLVRDAVPLAPSAVIDSGGGIHVYWIFEEPWILESDDDRQRAFSINSRLGWMLHAAAAKNGWTVDTVHDLARVLRLPGTLNYKYDPPRQVKLLTADEAGLLDSDTYTADNIEEILPEEKEVQVPEFNANTGVAIETAGMTFAVNFQAKPPQKFMEYMALEADATMRQTWGRERAIGNKEGQLADDTASEYTMSLVSRVTALGVWTDQELADLIMSWRIKHGELLKDGRPLSESSLRNKIVRTVQKVRAGRSESHVSDAVENIEIAVHDNPQNLGGNADVLANLSASLGLTVLGVEVVWSQAGGKYTLITPEGRVQLGGAGALLDSRAFREKVLDLTGILIRRYKGAAWDPLAVALRLVAEEMDIPSELESELEALCAYCQSAGVFKDVTAAAAHRNPYWRPSDGRLGFFMDAYLRWRMTTGTKHPATVRALFAHLKSVGLGARGSQGVAGSTVSVFLTTPEVTSEVFKRCAPASTGGAE
jgi:hypothetical protein